MSDAAVQTPLLLPLGPAGLLSLLHEPLVDDPRHAVRPVQRSGGRPRWNAFQALQATLGLLDRHRYRFLCPAAHPAQELCDHAVTGSGCRFTGGFGAAQRALGLSCTHSETGLSGPREATVVLVIQVPQGSISGGGGGRGGGGGGAQTAR